MKLKLNKTKSILAGIILIFLMVGSSFAYGFIQSVSPTQSNGNVELPKQSIIDYRLTSDQQRYLLRRGVTIAELEYSLACQPCRDTKAQLESAVQEFSNQMILSELVVGDSNTLPVVKMESSYGQRTFSKPTPDDLMSAFCDLLTSPPIRCATAGLT
jgi:hypothetical protein